MSWRQQHRLWEGKKRKIGFVISKDPQVRNISSKDLGLDIHYWKFTRYENIALHPLQPLTFVDSSKHSAQRREAKDGALSTHGAAVQASPISSSSLANLMAWASASLSGCPSASTSASLSSAQESPDGLGAGELERMPDGPCVVSRDALLCLPAVLYARRVAHS